jgi:hypothetical protein
MSERNRHHLNLCSALRWQGQFVEVEGESDSGILALSDGIHWCLYSQTCIGPDGELAEPEYCCSPDRRCYGTGQCG